jgi:DNA (cytosine-5)-methyltransferase 1
VKKNPLVIDLFAGAGGLSLGASRAGFSVASAVEIDKHALQTHAKNFPNSKHLDLDVAQLDGVTLLRKSGVAVGELGGLIGGPPCQGFSSIGRQNPEDSRNDLLGHFMRLVSETKPAFFVAENVPGLLTKKNVGTLQRALQKIPSNYVVLPPFKAEANRFGAATSRKRIFFIGFDPLRVKPLSHQDLEMQAATSSTTTVKDALAGLPQRILSSWLEEEAGWRNVDLLPRGFFADRAQGLIPVGVGDPESVERFLKHRQVSGNLGTRHAEEITKRYGDLSHGEMDKTSKSVRLDPGGFCPTLRAGTGSDKGSYQAVRPIHHSAARVITPREAARLQGFPDWFVFHATKWHSFRQIGNSVSPIVAESILATLYKKLRYSYNTTLENSG